MDPYSNRSYTYAQTRNAALDFGKGLKAIFDWKKGDVIGLYTPNSIDTPIVTWGALWAGGIVSPANPGYSVEELAFQLKDSGARALVTQWAHIDTARKAAEKVGIDPENIILIGDKRDPEGRHKHFTSVRNTSGATRYRKAKINPSKDLAFLVYSSGTTGLPKGVMLCHTNIVANTTQITSGESAHLDHRDSIVAFLPFFHIYGEWLIDNWSRSTTVTNI